MDLVLDNNIVIDHIDRREPFYELSRRVCLLGVVGEANTYISVNMLTDIYYLLRKDYGSQGAQDLIENNLSFLQLIGISAEEGACCAVGRFRGLPGGAVRGEDQGRLHRHAQREGLPLVVRRGRHPRRAVRPVGEARVRVRGG